MDGFKINPTGYFMSNYFGHENELANSENLAMNTIFPVMCVSYLKKRISWTAGMTLSEFTEANYKYIDKFIKAFEVKRKYMVSEYAVKGAIVGWLEYMEVVSGVR